MNAQDRAVVKSLLQYMTDKCLTGSDQFRAAMVYFDVTTTWETTKYLPETAEALGEEQNHIVDVFSPVSACHARRFTFGTEQEAKTFAMNARADENIPERELAQAWWLSHSAAWQARALERLHAEALEMDAEFNFELVSREINISDLPCMDDDRARWLDNRWAMFWKACDDATRASMVEAAHTEALTMNQSRSETVRAVIASAIHAGANSFGHVIGEHEQLVEILRDAGYADAAGKVDAVFETIGGDNHKAIRRSWLEKLREVSATI